MLNNCIMYYSRFWIFFVVDGAATAVGLFFLKIASHDDAWFCFEVDGRLESSGSAIFIPRLWIGLHRSEMHLVKYILAAGIDFQNTLTRTEW